MPIKNLLSPTKYLINLAVLSALVIVPSKSKNAIFILYFKFFE